MSSGGGSESSNNSSNNNNNSNSNVNKNVSTNEIKGAGLVGQIFGGIAEAVGSVVSGIGSFFSGGSSSAVTNVGDNISDIGSAARGTAKTVAGPIANILDFSDRLDAIKNADNPIRETAAQATEIGIVSGSAAASAPAGPIASGAVSIAVDESDVGKAIGYATYDFATEEAPQKIGDLREAISAWDQGRTSRTREERWDDENPYQNWSDEDARAWREDTGLYDDDIKGPVDFKDPIIIDLDGDGVEITPLNVSHTTFDFDNDGYEEKTAWVGAGDGILVWDEFNDGQILRAEEISLSDLTAATDDTDLQALAAVFDSNGDQLFDALDAQWSEFKVWNDRDQDGDIDAGEFKALSEYGIVRIALSYSNTESTVLSDQTAIYGLSDVTFERPGGIFETHLAGDVSLTYSTIGSRIETDANGYQTIVYEANRNASKKMVLAANGATSFALGTDIRNSDGSMTFSDWSSAVGNSLANVLDASNKIEDISLHGEEGNDQLTGGTGHDILIGGAGVDQLSGGAGNDTLVVDLDDLSSGTIDGGQGYDVISVSGATGVTLWMSAYNAEIAYGSDGNDTIHGDDDNLRLWTETAVVSSNGSYSAGWIDAGYTLKGRAGNDSLHGSLHDDHLDGGTGLDSLFGDDGDDVLNGGTGADQMWGGSGDDTVYVDHEDTHYSGDSGIDTLVFETSVGMNYALPQGGFENVIGGSGNDKFWADNANNKLDGGAGDDFLQSFGGDDVLIGGSGADTLLGGDGDDTVFADDDDVWFSGDVGVDTLVFEGTSNLEISLALGGFETIFAGSGNNKIWGKETDDKIYAEEGDDFIQAGAGNDTIIGGAGADSMQGQAGDDIIYADADDTWFSGDEGIDWLVYEGANDLQYALDQGAFENIRAGSGNNTIYGNGVGNIIELQNGNDVAFGYDGNDRIEGGAGNDWLAGGAGADLFVFKDGQTGADTISDFEAGASTGDVIQFDVGTFANFNALINASSDDGVHTTITIDQETTILLQNVLVSSLHQNDFSFV